MSFVHLTSVSFLPHDYKIASWLCIWRRAYASSPRPPSRSSPALQPHSSPWSPLNMPTTFLPHDLHACSSLSLKHYSTRHLYDLAPPLPSSVFSWNLLCKITSFSNNSSLILQRQLGILHFNSIGIPPCPELAQTSQAKGSTHKSASTSDARYKGDPQAIHSSAQPTTNFGVPTLPSGLIIC